ncbi:MAG: hypothetical protein L0Z55_02705 [Planctomycetes bacterium]|nr:hypothetical protein [Planctomycetota bacterium]
MTYFLGVRASGIDPVIIDGGDFLFAIKDWKANEFHRRQMTEKAKVIIEAYNIFGYAAAAVGECDLALGVDALLALRERMKFPLLCSNLARADDGTLVFPPSAIIEKSGYRLGVVAALTDALMPHFLERVAPGMKMLPAKEAVRAEVEKLADRVDAVIVLGQLDRPVVDEIADTFPGIDFILEPNSYFGNDSIWIADGNHFVERNGRLLLKVDGQGAHIGRIDATLAARGRPWIEKDAAPPDEGAYNRYAATDVELAPHIGINAEMEKMLVNYRKKTRFVQPEVSEQFTPSPNYLTVDTCGGCHPDQTTFWRETGHAKAYATLEKTGDEFRYDCVPCHVLGYGETFIDAHKPERYKDVQCESCHGTNPKHPADPKQNPWPDVDDKACWGCHNPKVTRAAFVPEEMIPKIQCPDLKRP